MRDPFHVFREALQKEINTLCQGVERVFFVDVDKDELWNTYLDSFPEGTNPIFRVNRVHDCTCCRRFVKSVGNIVSIKNGVVSTMWDIEIDDPTYQTVANKMAEYVRSKKIAGVYISHDEYVGMDFNFGDIDGSVTRFDHLNATLPSVCLYRGSDTLDTVRGEYRDIRTVFQRSLEEISEVSVADVLELIALNSLYKGEEWKDILEKFLSYKRAYDKLADDGEKDLFAWEMAVKVGPVLGKIRNRSIGTLLVDLSSGIDMDEAVRRYDKLTAPENYRRPDAVYSPRMLEAAKTDIYSMGYADSLQRRFAILDDISVNDVLFSNRDASKRIQGASDLFGEMEKGARHSGKRFSRVEEISIQDFISKVLPSANEVEAFVEDKHAPNMVSLIAPVIPGSKSMFKWGNPISWAYSGNMTDSAMKSRVKAAGGNVDGDLRFSIQWNEGRDYDGNDLDAHCVEPNGNEICYLNCKKPGRSRSGGQLDVDIIHPVQGNAAVENITWPDRTKMAPGRYSMFVHCYSYRGGCSGFRAEIEFDGKIYSFNCPNVSRQGQRVKVAEVILDNQGNFSIIEKLSSSVSVGSKEVWGVQTNTFVPVSVVCYSPNYWGGNSGIGHRHFFFMLKGCVNPENPNGFYNEFINSELDKHKRVIEALGSRAHVQDSEDQLSGLGFSSTKRNDLIVKVIGNTERVLKIKF